jgi:hypothetical protein
MFFAVSSIKRRQIIISNVQVGGDEKDEIKKRFLCRFASAVNCELISL